MPQFISTLSIIIIVLCIAWHMQIRKQLQAIANENALCRIARRDACTEYRACLRMGYSARAARSTVRALLHTRYGFKGAMNATVLRLALSDAYTYENIFNGKGARR